MLLGLLLLIFLTGSSAANCPTIGRLARVIVLFEFIAEEKTSLALTKPTALTVWKEDVNFLLECVPAPPQMEIANNTMFDATKIFPAQVEPTFINTLPITKPMNNKIIFETKISPVRIEPISFNATFITKPMVVLNRIELEMIRKQNHQRLDVLDSLDFLLHLTILFISLNLLVLEIVEIEMMENKYQDEVVAVVTQAVQTESESGYSADDELSCESEDPFTLSEEDAFFEAEQVLQEIIAELDDGTIEVLFWKHLAEESRRLKTIPECSEPSSESDPGTHSDC